MQSIFNDSAIAYANTDDIPAIRDLLNNAYRGEDSRQGWTTEAHLIAGNVRTTDNTLLSVMERPGSVMLKYTAADGQLIGCVNLQQHGNRIYLGMFSVSPKLQGGGIGKKLLSASEAHAVSLNCSSIYMRVISVRTELVDWYKRHGYSDTGERESFEEDASSGKHLQQLEFMVLEKFLH
ncbi:MAG TPA: GNAT family N-acetyltransferase [Ferruginibacter sp.]|nr:GNAT family N-acetyltransferase [Chitinophagaceae bacterium]HRI24624.1 GNAT family N-acetyltransferase [Ferruginibacter sp.]